jgi:glucose-1-phosphate cytidylyltransferase
LADGTESYHNNKSEKWKVTLVDTGLNTMTGGRIKRIAPYVKNEELFCLTYGDGVCDVNINKLVSFHREHGKEASLLAIQPAGRFGAIEMDNGQVRRFAEKPETGGGYINGGFFVLSPKVLDTITGDDSIWERAPMENLASRGQLMAYQHEGFWQCMDTLRDKDLLESLWKSGEAPWRLW